MAMMLGDVWLIHSKIKFKEVSKLKILCYKELFFYAIVVRFYSNEILMHTP